MNLYEPKTDKTEEDTANAGLTVLATSVGVILGLASIAALEALLAWLILTYLVGISVTYLQTFGIMLIVNAITSKFK
jgi:hypothetical protein